MRQAGDLKGRVMEKVMKKRVKVSVTSENGGRASRETEEINKAR